MKGSLITFATDFLDEGFEQVLNNAQERAGLDAVTMACNYHHSRDVFPHNPVRKVHYFQGGVYFQADPRRYAGLKLQPDVSPLVREVDPLARAIKEAQSRGLALRGWTNNMHSTSQGSQHLDCTVENAFGDRYITNLCPANPDVRAYTRALSADLARYPIESLLLESVSYMPFEHGYHHERLMIPLSPAARYLMGLCFCEHCMAAARARGVDAARLRSYAREQLQLALDGDACDLDGVPVERKAIAALAGGEVGGLLDAREEVVTSFVGEVVEAVHAVRPLPVVIMEWSGGLRGAGMGMPVPVTPTAAPARAWQDGVDLAAVLQQADGVSTLGYVRDLDALRVDLDAYRAAIPEGKSLSVALRPMLPDCGSPEELAAKIDFLRDSGVDCVEFYHYAMMRLSSLDWIRQAFKAREGLAG